MQIKQDRLNQRHQLIQRLEKLAERDREALSIFAGRCALRVMPWLATDIGLAYWKDKQVKHLLAVEAASVSALLYSIDISAAYDSKPMGLLHEAYYAAEHVTSGIAANDVAYAAVHAIRTAYDDGAAFTAYAAYANADDAAATYDAYTDDSACNDLKLLEKNQQQQVKESPLWVDQHPPTFTEQLSRFTQTLQALNQQPLLERYQALLKGGTDPAVIYKGVLEHWLANKDQDTPSTRTAAEKPSGQDHLNRNHLAGTLSSFLLDKDNGSHQTIGLLGDWGVGKTTFIRLLKEALKNRAQGVQFLYGDYNAWEFEHTPNQQAGMAQKAIEGLTGDLNGWQKWWLALSLSWKNRCLSTVLIPAVLLPLALLLTLFSSGVLTTPATVRDIYQAIVPNFITDFYGSNPMLANVLHHAGVIAFLAWNFLLRIPALLRSPTYKYWSALLSLPNFQQDLGTIPVMRRQIENLAQLRLGEDRAVKQRFLFVIDDLDRCNHKAIVRVLEAVRLVMDIKGVVVMIAIDHRVALASLALHYQAISQYYKNRDANAIGRDYLAKLIHLPIQLQQPDKQSVATYLASLWGQTGTGSAQVDKEATKNNRDNNDEATGVKDIQPPTITSALAPDPPMVKDWPAGKQSGGMSDAQKQAFTYWCDHFEIANPRQVKRLYNTYNLLRHYYNEASIVSEPTEAAQGNYPMLAALFALEYAFAQQMGVNDLAIADKLVEVKRRMGEDFAGICAQIKPFVLPSAGPVSQTNSA